jgi:type IV fimbrial biogenesis protein FimT
VSTVIAGTPTTLLTQNSFAGVAITDSASLGTLTYGKDGRTTTASTKFAICPPAPVIAGVAMRCVSVGLSGVPSSTPLNNPTLTTAGSCLPCS